MHTPMTSMARLQSCLAQSGGVGGGRRGPNTCAFKPATILPGRDCRMKQHKVRLATSLSEKLESFIACGTFMSGRLMRSLMTFSTLAGSTELDLTIMANGITTWSRERKWSGVHKSKGTLHCRDLAQFLELLDAGDGAMWLDGLEIK